MKKILIANRGEIAVRIIRACRELGVSPVAVYSECDRDGAARALRRRGVRDRRRARRARATCASIALIDAAQARPAPTRVHPGYGFLAENEDFAAAVRDAGLTFIGPTPEAIETDGQQDRGADGGASAPACRSCPGTEDPLAADVARRRDRAGRRRRSAIRCS